jgi:DNA uptake protein ComE-like DNA-binding protein
MKRTTLGTLAIALVVCLVSSAAPAGAQAGNNMGVANPNRASSDELAALPHVTAELAAAIVAGRPYLSMADFNAVVTAHLSPEQAAELYVGLFLPINLNDVTNEERLMVPGVGRRMAHEFEEYQPYVAMEQFRREIGKYVDEEEVARLEQYVFIPIELNTASDEDILSIPGMGKRMLHEFKEYRPYVAIEQFRREIGKYVDDDEVARLERYVTVVPESD